MRPDPTDPTRLDQPTDRPTFTYMYMYTYVYIHICIYYIYVLYVYTYAPLSFKKGTDPTQVRSRALVLFHFCI